jgi:hypothetical protein
VVRPAALALLLLLLTSCAAYHIDYIDFVKHGGVTYTSIQTIGRPLTDADLGSVQFRVKNTLSALGNPGYQPADGDAAFVPSGEPVYAVRGYASTFRLAARHDGRLVLYEADSNPAARRGADLLDIEGKVTSIVLFSERDGRTIVGRITDPARIADLVGQVLGAPVDQSPPTDVPQASGTPRITGSPSAMIGFEFADGTGTSRAYDMTANVLARGIRVGGSFRSAITELIAAAPTPSPVPAVVNIAKRYDLAHATRVTIKGPKFVQDATLIPRFAAALDADLAATRSTVRVVNGPIVIFEFADHVVSLAYDRDADLLRVVVPDDEFAVRPNAEFRALLDGAR